MKIKSVNYQKTFNLGNYSSERIGVEIELDNSIADESPEAAIAHAKELVEKFHKENNPGLYYESRLTKEFTEFSGSEAIKMAEKYSPTHEEKTLSLEDQISSCKEIKVLESYRFIAKSNPDLQKIYDKKMKELSK